MDLYNNYNLIRSESLKGLRITYKEIKPLINHLDKKIFNTETIGYSEDLIPIHRISFGKGNVKVLMWSQMHGDESTATKSIFDLFNIVNHVEFTNVISKILDNCTIYVIPMLNPDGSDLFTRENLHGLDLNRDAITLKNSESRILMDQVKSLKPDFAFNLHDQTSYYNVDRTDKVATISLLAPASDELRSVTESRKSAMSVISSINKVLQKYIPGQVGRYNDSFCENCFGDTIQSLGIPTILFESGYFIGDEIREETRRLHTIALLEALETIASKNLPDFENYFKIPVNEKRFYDKKIKNVLYNGKITSVGVRYKYVLIDQKLVKIIDSTETIVGENLKNMFFHEVLDANGADFNIFC